MGKPKKSKSSDSKPAASETAASNSIHMASVQDEGEHIAEQKRGEVSSQSETQDFESFYLQQVTAEFADDLDKVRNASDFGDRSLPILIAALKQGTSIYSEEERRKVMGNK